MKHSRKLRITQEDFLLANRRASRAEEIEKFGRPIIFRTITQKSKKVYDRNSFKRAGIKNDDGSFYACLPSVFIIFADRKTSFTV